MHIQWLKKCMNAFALYAKYQIILKSKGYFSNKVMQKYKKYNVLYQLIHITVSQFPQKHKPNCLQRL